MESSHSVSRRRQTAPEPRGSKFQILESWCKRGQRKVTRLAGMGKTVRGVLQRRDGSGSQRYERAVLNAGCVAPRREAPAAPPFLATPTCQSVLGLAGAFWAPDTPTSSVRSTAMATATPGAAAAAAPDVGTLFLSKREARLSRTGPVPAPGRGSQHDALPWGHPRRDYALEFGGPSRTRHSTTTKRGGRAEENGDGVPHCVPMPALRPKRVRCSEDRGFDA
ncbi:hypothetical protein HPB47_025828 [Ixodes persulcatus]|uniref:Uncharacterized protein n=1 Tax=Ixodes persulcatus TaxID=34615 RepID=A0AC60Q182_IXOPE|nr:hypothetical protein HPB47_025828 [Ixodes persulcatus]